MILNAWSRSHSVLLSNFLTCKWTRSNFELKIAPSHLCLLELGLHRRLSVISFMTIHGWTLTVVLVSNWCAQICLSTVSCEQRDDWLCADVCEIWRWFEGPISSNLSPSSFLWLWRRIPNLKLPPTIEISIVLNVRSATASSITVVHHMNRTLSVHHNDLVRRFVHHNALTNCQHLVALEIPFIRTLDIVAMLCWGGMLDVDELMVRWSCNRILLSCKSHGTWQLLIEFEEGMRRGILDTWRTIVNLMLRQAAIERVMRHCNVQRLHWSAWVDLLRNLAIKNGSLCLS